VLWTRFLKYNPRDPDWVDRDRFVLSAGHGSALLYSLLYLTGHAICLDDIRQFRQWGSKTPGHPERGLTPGVEVTTGPNARIRAHRRPRLCARNGVAIMIYGVFAITIHGGNRPSLVVFLRISQ